MSAISTREKLVKDGSEDSVPIKIPRKLLGEVCGKIESTDFEVVRKYIIYVVKKDLAEKEEIDFYEKDKKEIIRRLGKLGYF